MRPRQAGAIAVMAVLTATACGPGKPPPQSPPGGLAPPDFPAATPDARSHAADVYVQMWRSYERALAEGNADSAYLAEYAEGPALLLLTRAVRSSVAAGLRGAGATVLSPKVTGVHPMADPARVTVVDCMDTSPTRLYRADGSAYADIPGGRRQMTAAVVLSGDGKWRVSQIQLGQVGSC